MEQSTREQLMKQYKKRVTTSRNLSSELEKTLHKAQSTAQCTLASRKQTCSGKQNRYFHPCHALSLIIIVIGNDACHPGGQKPIWNSQQEHPRAGKKLEPAQTKSQIKRNQQPQGDASHSAHVKNSLQYRHNGLQLLLVDRMHFNKHEA